MMKFIYWVFFVLMMCNLILWLDLLSSWWFKMVEFDSGTYFCIVHIYLIFLIQVYIFSWWFACSTFIIFILRGFKVCLNIYLTIYWCLFLCWKIYFLLLFEMFIWFNRRNNFTRLLFAIEIRMGFILFLFSLINNLELDILQVNTWLWIRLRKLLLSIFFKDILFILIDLDWNLRLLILFKHLKGISIQW